MVQQSKEVGMSLGSTDLKNLQQIRGRRQEWEHANRQTYWLMHTNKVYCIYLLKPACYTSERNTTFRDKIILTHSLHPPKHDHSFWFNPKSIQLHDISHPHTWAGPYNWLSEAKCCTFLFSSSLFAPTILSICFPSLINKKVGIACTSHSAITSCTSPVAQSLHFHKQTGHHFSSASQNLTCSYTLLQTENSSS